MQDDWDYYLCRLDDDRASVYLNLALAAAAPITTHPHAAVVSIPMLHPTADGMSSDEEYQALTAIEDDLNAHAVPSGAIYAGRLTTRGSRVFYFYGADLDRLVGAIKEVLAQHPAYCPQISSHADPDWALYSRFLWPSPDSYQQIRRRRQN